MESLEGGREKLFVRVGFEEFLFEVFKEGFFWVVFGCLLEVMLFLRGKFLGNGFSLKVKEEF